MKTVLNKGAWIVCKGALATAVLGGFLLFAGAQTAKANDWDDGNRRVAYTDWRLHESIERYGYYSPQANHWRHERHEAYERLAHRRHEWREHHRGYDDRYHHRYRGRD